MKVDRSPKAKEVIKIIEEFGGKIRPKGIWMKTKKVDPDLSLQAIAAYTRVKGMSYGKKKKKGGKGSTSVVWFAENTLGMKLHNGQKRFLRVAQAMILREVGYQKLILCPAYQYGKTVSMAILHIWINYYKLGIPDHLQKMNLEHQTLAISPKLTQAMIIYKYIQWILQGKFWWTEGPLKVFKVNKCKIPDFLKGPTTLPSHNSLSNTPMLFNNGSKIRIASTSGDQASGLQGDQFTFISYDECVLSLHLEEELPTRLESRLIKYGGSMVMAATPDPMADSNQYYMHICQLGLENKDGFKTFIGKLDDNNFIPKANRERLKKEIKRTNPELYRAAVFGEFSSSVSRIYTSDEVNNLWNKSLKMEGPLGNHNYWIGVDWAMAGGWTVMFVVDTTDDKNMKIVHMDRFRGSSIRPEEQYAKLKDLQIRYNDAEGVHDGSSMGGKIIEQDIEDLGMTALDYGGPDRKGNIIYALKKVLAEDRLKSPYISQLAKELGSYKREDKRLTKDCICALASIFYIKEEGDSQGVQAFNIEL